MTAKEEGKTSAQIVDELLKELQSKSYSDSSPAPPTDGAEGSKNKDPPEYQEKVPSESTEPSKTSRHKRKRHHRSHSTDGECSDNDGKDRHKSRRHKHKKKKKKSSGHDSDGEHRCKSSRKRRHKDKDRGNRAGIESNAGVVWNVLHTHSSDEVEWESDTSWNTKQKLLSAYKKSESKTDASGDTDSRHVNSSPSQTVTESSVVAVDLSEKEKEIVELEDTTKLSASQTLVECDFTTEQLKPAVVPNVPEEIQITAVVTPPNINIVNPSVITLMSPADALNIESSQHSYDGTSSVLVTGPAALEVSTLELYEQKSFKVEADVPTACTAKSDTGYLLGVLVGAREDLPLAPPIKPSSTKDDTAPIEKKSEHLMFTDFWRLRHSSYVPSDGLRCGKVALETAIKNIPSQDSGVVTEQSSTMKMVLPNETIPTVAQYENKPVVEQYHSSKCEYVKETCAPGIVLSDEREIRPCFVLTNNENPVNAPTLEGSGSQILTKVLSPRKSATTECMSNSCTAIDDGLFKAEVYSSQLISSVESKCSNSTLDVDCLSQHRAEVTASTAVVSVKPPNNHPLHLLKSELNENTIPAIEMPSRLSPELKQEIHSVVENPTEPSPELKKDVRSPVEASNESSVLTLSERPQEKTAVMLDGEVDKLKPRVPLVDYDDDVECVELTVEPIETIMTPTVCEGIQHVPSVEDGVPGNEGKKLDIEAPTKTLVHVYEVSGIENSSETVQVDTNAILVEDDNRQVFADNPVLVPKVSSEITTEKVDYDDDVECVELTVEPIETIMTTVCEGIQHVPSVGDGVPGNEGKKLDIEAPTKTLVHVYEVSGIENSSEMVQVDTNAILVEDNNRQVFADNPVLLPKVSSEITTEKVDYDDDVECVELTVEPIETIMTTVCEGIQHVPSVGDGVPGNEGKKLDIEAPTKTLVHVYEVSGIENSPEMVQVDTNAILVEDDNRQVFADNPVLVPKVSSEITTENVSTFSSEFPSQTDVAHCEINDSSAVIPLNETVIDTLPIKLGEVKKEIACTDSMEEIECVALEDAVCIESFQEGLRNSEDKLDSTKEVLQENLILSCNEKILPPDSTAEVAEPVVVNSSLLSPCRSDVQAAESDCIPQEALGSSQANAMNTDGICGDVFISTPNEYHSSTSLGYPADAKHQAVLPTVEILSNTLNSPLQKVDEREALPSAKPNNEICEVTIAVTQEHTKHSPNAVVKSYARSFDGKPLDIQFYLPSPLQPTDACKESDGVDSLPGKLPNPFRAMMKSGEKPPNLLPSNNVDTAVQKKSVDISMLKVEHEVSSTLHDRYRNDPPLTAIDQISSHRDVQADTTANTSGSAAELSKDVMSPGETSDKTVLLNYTCDEPSPNSTYGLLPSLHVETLASSECISGVSVSDSTCILSIVASDHVTVVDTSSNGVHSCSPDKLSQENIDSETVILISESKSELCDNIMPNSFSSDDLLVKLSQHSSSSVSVNPCDARLSCATANKIMSKPDASSLCDDLNSNEIGRGLNQSNIVELPNESRSVSVLSYGNELSKTVHDVSCSDSAAEMPVLDVRKVLSPSTFDKTVSDSSLQSITYTLACKHDTAKTSAPAKDVPLPATCNVYPSTHSDRIMSSTYVSKLSVAKDADSSVPKSAVCVSVLPTISSTTEACTNSANDNVLSSAFSGVISSSLCNKTGTYQSMSNTLPSEVCSLLPCKLESDTQMDFSSEQLLLPYERGLEPKLQLTSSKMKNEIPTPVDKLAEKPLPCKIANELPIPPSTPKSPMESQLLPEIPYEIPLPLDIPLPSEIPLPREPPPELLPPLPLDTPPEIPLPPELPDEIPLPPEIPVVMGCHAVMPTGTQIPVEEQATTIGCTVPNLTTNLTTCSKLGSVTCRLLTPSTDKSSSPYSVLNIPLPKLPVSEHVQQSIAVLPSLLNSKPLPIVSMFHTPRTVEHRENSPSDNDVDSQLPIGCSSSVKPLIIDDKFKTQVSNPIANDSTKSTSPDHKEMYQCYKVVSQPSGSLPVFNHSQEESLSTKTEVSSEDSSSVFVPGAAASQSSKVAWKLFPCMPSAHKSLFSLPVKKDSQGTKILGSTSLCSVPSVFGEQTELFVKERESPVRSPSPELTPEQLLIERELRERLLRSALHITSAYKGMLPPSKLAEVAALLATNKSAEAAALVTPASPAPNVNTEVGTAELNKRKDGQRVSVDVRSPLKADDTVVDADQLQSTVALPQHSRSVHVPVEDLSRMESVASKVCCKVVGTASEPVRLERQWVLMPISECFMSADLPSSSVSNQPLVEDSDTQSNLLEDVKKECCSATDTVAPPLADHTKTVSLNEHGKAETFPSKIDNQPGMVFEPRVLAQTGEFDKGAIHDNKIQSTSATVSENSKVALLRLNAFAQTVTNKPTAPQPLNSIVSDSKRKKLTILMPDKLPTKQVSKVSRWGPKSSEMEVPPPVSTKAAPSTWAAMVSQQKSLLKESQASRFTSKTPLVPDVGGVQPANVPRLETVLRLQAAELRSSAASDSDLVIHSKISLQDKLRKLAQYPDFIGPEKAQTLPASGCQAASSSARQNSRHGSGHTVSRLPGTSTANPITDKPCFVTSGTTSSLQEKLCKLAQYSKDMSKSPPIHSQEKKSAIHIVDKSFDTKPVSEASVGATTVQEKLRLLAAYPETLPTVNTDVTNVKLNTSLQSSIGLRPVVGGDGKNEEESSAREEGELSPHSKESGVSSAEEVDEYVIRPNVKRKKNRSRHRSRRRKKKKHSSSQKKIEKSRKSSNGTSRASRSHSPLPSKKPKCSRLRKSPSPVRIDALKVHAAPVVCGESSVKISTDLLLKPHIHPDDVSCGKPGLLKSEGVNELQLHATFPDKFKHQSEVQTGNLVETLVEKTNQIGEVTKDELSQLGEDHTQISKVDVDCDDEIKQRKKEKKERDRQRKKEKKEQEKERKREKKELEKERKREKKEEKERKKEKEKQRDLSQRKDHDREHDQVKIHDRSRGHSRSKDKDGSQDRERIRRRDRSKDRSRSKDRHRSPGHDSKDHEHKKDFGASKDNEHSKGRDHSKDHDSNTTLDRSKTRDGSKECSHVRDRSKERDHRDKVDEKDNSIHSKERDQRHRSRNRESSNQRDRSRDRDRRDRSTDKDRTKVRDHSKERDRSKDRERSRDRDRRSRRWRSRSRSLSRRRSRTRSRSRSRDRWRTSPRRSRVTDLREKIDKAKLLEIARKNAIAMISQGRLPPGVKVDSLKQEQVVAIKAGGKSVAELTDFCKLLVKKEGEESSDSGGDRQGLASDDEGDGPFIQHPFKLRDSQPNIVMKIRNATQLPVKTSAEKAVDCSKLRIQFPVSSGSHHRVKESEWVPVSPPKAPTTAPAAITAPVAKPEETTVAVIAPADKVFNDPPAQPVVDIGSIVSARLRAVRKLQENPNDVEALTLVHQAQQQMQNWAESKQLPGQFTGTANARMLTPEELAGPSHLQAWVKKDQFNRAAPIDGGMGMYLLRKMGWNPGEGLGKNKEGVTEPLVLDIKMDKKGLTSSDETVRKLQSHHPVAKDLSGKHPVSALVELCSKRRWGPPEFTLIHDSGPDHKKNFLFKVKVNCVEYQPAVASPNKKHAKAQSATICLQQFGLVPKEHKQNTASK